MTTSPLQNARRLIFPGKQQVTIESFDAGKVKDGEVGVRTHLSLMSIGTENIVFNRFFDPGTHWDQWVKYPFYPGYTSVGTVEVLSDGATSFKVGDRVAFRVPHASHAILKQTECYPIPNEISFEKALWFSLAKIAFQGARAAQYRLGDSVLVIGAGPIGQMSIRWAKAAGATPIIVVDALPNRMKLAREGGATAAIAAPINQVKEAVLAAGAGHLPRVVIDSTGNPVVFSAALGLAADLGKVVILGDTGQPCLQTLTSDVIMRGLTVVGAHDIHNTLEWNDASISHLFFSLAASNRFSLDGLTSHVFLPEQCADAYAIANRDRASTHV